ncbi:MAG: hypothetical protein MUC55_11755 [Burkholderiales bacterium]|jgi:hypothetical protein|nr:hypothetical protein [Burkholderiales bacterium]
MDTAELKLRYEGAREFDHWVGGRRYRLRIPTQSAARQVFKRLEAAGERLDIENFARELLPEHVIGWDAIPAAWLVPDADPCDPLPWSPTAARLLMAEDQQLASELAGPLFERFLARRDALEEARKNSPSASPGT